MGCASEGTSGRALNGGSTATDTMTIESCRTFCAGRGFSLAGLEYARECFCGNALVNGGAYLTGTAANTCNMACKGDAKQICGGPSRLSVYKTNVQSPQVVPSAGAYRSLGCYTEGIRGRALSGASMTNDTMTVEGCVDFCSKKNMAYAGLEYARECYCGNTLGSGSQSEVVAEGSSSQCNMVCAGNKQQMCGGPSRLNMYTNRAAAKR